MSEVPWFLFICSFNLVVNIYFHLVVQATRSRASSPSAFGQGGPHAVRFAPGEAQIALWVRLPAGLRAPGPGRPETHSFHLPWGEMTVTLEDVALLFGLPCSGEPMGAVDPATGGATISSRGSPKWCTVLTPEVPDFTNSHDPMSAWLRKYNVLTSIYHFSAPD
jgi:hypothetical protein